MATNDTTVISLDDDLTDDRHPLVKVATHPAVVHPVRHSLFVPYGAWVLLSRFWNALTGARFTRAQKAAEAAGDHATSLEWEDARRAWADSRHYRFMDRAELLLSLVKWSPYLIGGGALALAFTSICLAIGERSWKGLEAPWLFVAHAVVFCIWVVGVAAVPVLLGLLGLLPFVLWHVGRKAAMSGEVGWILAPPQDEQEEETGFVLTADTIAQALRHLGHPAINKAVKDGWQTTLHTPPVRDGNGYSAVFSLPLGATPGQISDRRDVLARNLHRAPAETWISDAERDGQGPAGSVAVWIADPGSLDKGVGAYPLQHTGTSDVFRGVVAGQSARGDDILYPLVGSGGGTVLGGRPGAGKSNALRILVAGAILDPLCIVSAHVFALNGDLDAMEPRLERLVRGLDEEHLAAATQFLSEIYEEVGRREKRLADLGAKKLSRSIAEQHEDLRPWLICLSECHELFGSSEYGKLAGELAVKIVKRARKAGIFLVCDTQSARKESLPGALVEVVAAATCFSVRSWLDNDRFLPAGSFASGVRATELRHPQDRGTSITTGVSERAAERLTWYYLAADDEAGTDDATEITERAMSIVRPGTPTGCKPVVVEQRDLLEDLDEALGEDRVRLADLPALLRDLAGSSYLPYRSLTGSDLKALLADEGVRTTNTGNVPRLAPKDLRAVLADRRLDDEE